MLEKKYCITALLTFLIFTDICCSTNQNNQSTYLDDPSFISWLKQCAPNIDPHSQANYVLLCEIYGQKKEIKRLDPRYLSLISQYELYPIIQNYNPFNNATNNNDIRWNIDCIDQILADHEQWIKVQSANNSKLHAAEYRQQELTPIGPNTITNAQHLAKRIEDYYLKMQNIIQKTSLEDLPNALLQDRFLIQHVMKNSVYATNVMTMLLSTIKKNSTSSNLSENIDKLFQTVIPLIPTDVLEQINPRTGQNMIHTILCPLHWVSGILDTLKNTNANLLIPTTLPDKFPGSNIVTTIAYMRFFNYETPQNFQYNALQFIKNFTQIYPESFTPIIYFLIRNFFLRSRASHSDDFSKTFKSFHRELYHLNLKQWLDAQKNEARHGF